MKVLVVGVNTRPVVNSVKNLGYEIYSVSYYNPMDLNADKKKYIINDKQHGHFKDKYDEKELINLSKSYVDEVDLVFVCSGIFEDRHSKTPDWDVVGNSPKKIKRVSNKYHTIRKLENLGYNVPITYIANNLFQLEKYLSELKSAVIKPISGSGGMGVVSLSYNELDWELKRSKDILNMEFPVIVQELIQSDSFSASFIGLNFITFNKQIIKNNIYTGNITPYMPENILKESTISQFKELIEAFDLEGMNGIDFMIKEGNPHILEINPRILGTFETIEMSAKENLINAIIKNKPVKPKSQFFKRILFAKEKLISYIKKQPFVFDIPRYGAIIEQNEPLTTVIGRNIDEINNVTDHVFKRCINYETK